jgi:SAM-dependent methyltransferase
MVLRKIRKFYSVSRDHGVVTAIRQTLRWAGSVRLAVAKSGRISLRSSALGHVRRGDGSRSLAGPESARQRIPLPPLSLMQSVGSTHAESFLQLGEAWAQLIRDELEPDSTILDIGCGCGRVARWFADDANVAAYVGFDVIEESVAWCRNFLSPLASRKYRFERLDVQSDEYNPGGTIPASEVVFPLATGAAHVVIAASLFTHLFENDTRRYLRETARVLDPARGSALLSILRLPNGAGSAGNEARMEYGERHFLQMAADNGLVVANIHGEVLGQYVVRLKRAP